MHISYYHTYYTERPNTNVCMTYDFNQLNAGLTLPMPYPTYLVQILNWNWKVSMSPKYYGLWAHTFEMSADTSWNVW